MVKRFPASENRGPLTMVSRENLIPKSLLILAAAAAGGSARNPHRPRVKAGPRPIYSCRGERVSAVLVFLRAVFPALFS